MKKLLIIGYVWPEPNSSAAGSRMMQLIRYFQQQGYAVTFASPAQQTDHMINLSIENIATQVIKLNCKSFDSFAATLQPDIVMFDRFMMEEQFGWRIVEQCPKAMRLLDSEDLFCLRHTRHHAFKNQQIFSTDDLLSSELAKREIASIFRCDLTLTISKVEMTLLQQVFKVPGNLLHYCPFMFESSQLTLPVCGFDQRQDFISIGNFRHAPNWDAVLWLKQQIWPLIRAQLPQAKLLVCGAYPPPKATALHDKKSGFIVKGWIDDALKEMQSAKVCLAPLRFGAGIKGKLAEAMICGTPSVTTDIGAESMGSDKPWGGAIVNDAKEIASAAVALYQEQKIWQTASDNGIKNCQNLYDKTQHYSALTMRLNQLTSHLTSHRHQNFIGSMLMHHSCQSTKYMAQWIEAKNKNLPED